MLEVCFSETQLQSIQYLTELPGTPLFHGLKPVHQILQQAIRYCITKWNRVQYIVFDVAEYMYIMPVGSINYCKRHGNRLSRHRSPLDFMRKSPVLCCSTLVNVVPTLNSEGGGSETRRCPCLQYDPKSTHWQGELHLTDYSIWEGDFGFTKSSDEYWIDRSLIWFIAVI